MCDYSFDLDTVEPLDLNSDRGSKSGDRSVCMFDSGRIRDGLGDPIGVDSRCRNVRSSSVMGSVYREDGMVMTR